MPNEQSDIYRDDRNYDKCKWERAWGELNAALHARSDAMDLSEALGSDHSLEQEYLADLVEEFDEIAEKHNVEAFEECWDGDVEECADHEASPPNETDSDEWEFEPDEIVRERHEQVAPGGVNLGKSEYRIKWRLQRETNGKRCYYVEKEEGGTHLYTAPVLEGRYEVIDASESRAWSADTAAEDTEVGEDAE